MKNRKLYALLIVLLMGILVLAACGGSEEPTPEPAAPAEEEAAPAEEEAAPAEEEAAPAEEEAAPAEEEAPAEEPAEEEAPAEKPAKKEAPAEVKPAEEAMPELPSLDEDPTEEKKEAAPAEVAILLPLTKVLLKRALSPPSRIPANKSRA